MIARSLSSAILAGIAGGLIAAFLHVTFLTPLILEAERYEVAAASETEAHEHDAARQPADGGERMLYTAITDLAVATGWALLLVALYTLRGRPVGWRAGLLWGLAGFAATSLMPALRLPPELPGMASGALAQRQFVWIAIAIATASGLTLLAFASQRWMKFAGLVAIAAAVLLLPVPHSDSVSTLPDALHRDFVLRSVGVALVMWLVIGSVSGWLFDRASLQTGTAPVG